MYGDFSRLPGQQYTGVAGVQFEPLGFHWSNGSTTGILSAVSGAQLGFSDTVAGAGKVGGRLKLLATNKLYSSVEVDHFWAINLPGLSDIMSMFGNANQAGNQAVNGAQQASSGNYSGASSTINNAQNLANQASGSQPVLDQYNAIRAILGGKIGPLGLEAQGVVSDAPVVAKGADGSLGSQGGKNMLLNLNAYFFF